MLLIQRENNYMVFYQMKDTLRSTITTASAVGQIKSASWSSQVEYLYEDVVVGLEDEDGRPARRLRLGRSPLVRHQVLVAHVARRILKVA